jgi:HEAT repeat protein
LLAAGAAALALWILIATQRPGEPRYQGIPISKWIARGNWGSPVHEAVNAFGTNAVPYLVPALTRNSSALDRALPGIWRDLPESFRRKHPDWMPMDPAQARLSAQEWLRQLGPDARRAVPALIALTRSTNDLFARAAGVGTLAIVGRETPEAAAAIVGMLKDTNAAIHPAAAFAIGDLGTNANAAVPALIEYTKNQFQLLPYNSLLALGHIGSGARDAMPVVLEAFDDPTLRNNALVALEGISANQEAPVSRMIDMLRDSNSVDQRMLALKVLLTVGPAAQAALPVLERMRTDTNRMLRVFSAVVAARVQANPELALPLLLDELEAVAPPPPQHWNLSLPYDEIPALNGLNSRTTAIEFLGQIGPTASMAVSRISHFMTNGTDDDRALAARAVWRIEHDAEHVLPELGGLISRFVADRSGGQISFAVILSTCREMGPSAKPALPALENYYNSKTNSWSRRQEVRNTLRVIER